MGKIALPRDGEVHRYPGGGVSVIYTLPGGVKIWWQLENPDDYDLSGMPIVDVTAADQDADGQGRWIRGGWAQELRNVSTDFGTFGRWAQQMITAVVGDGPAKDDPEILNVIGQLMARPDMSDSELQGLLRTTNYYKKLTDKQREWNDLSDAERNVRVDDAAAQLADTYLREVGAQINFDDETLRTWALNVASGKVGVGSALMSWIRPKAKENPESPYMRTVRNEQENQRKRGVDASNQAGQARALAERWGVNMSDQSLTEWGLKIISNEASQKDFEDYLRKQAKVLYPWKDEAIPTMDAAQPWIDTYGRVLETGNPSLFNPVVQQALTTGMPLFEFEKQLKSRPEWLQTSNANQELSSMAAQIGRQMGFV